jgi:hypothetical protein
MAVFFRLKDREVQNALNKLKQLKNDLAKEVDMEIGAAAEDIATLARNKAPEFIAGGISVEKLSFLRYSINSNFQYSAYYEFGTGDFYKKYQGRLTNEWREIAKKYYVNGLGTTKQQPFLFPSVKQVQPKLYKKLYNLIITKK